MKLKSYSISIEDNRPVKSPTLWGHDSEKNSITPLVYFRKPKCISEESFKKIVEGITLNISKDLEIKLWATGQA